MKRVTQRLHNGRIEVLDVVAPEGVLVDARASLLGVEIRRSTVEAARQGLIGESAHCAGRSAVLDDYRRLGLQGGKHRVLRDRAQDRVHCAQFVSLATGARSEPPTAEIRSTRCA